MSKVLPFIWLIVLVAGLVFTPAPGRTITIHEPVSISEVSSRYTLPSSSSSSSSSASHFSASSHGDERPEIGYVWISGTGKRYHSSSSCSGMKDPVKVTLEEAEDRGLSPCQNCY